ncbi:MAG: hypothetical protein R2867_37690 [Caldilineaceae bacterium]
MKRFAGQRKRYRLLETIRQYAQEKLAASTEWMTAQDTIWRLTCTSPEVARAT